MDLVAAYLAGFLTPLIILNGWYVIVRLRRGYQDTRSNVRRVA